MKNKLKRLVIIAPLVFTACSTSSKGNVRQPSAQIQTSDIQPLVDEAQKIGNLPAIGLLVRKSGKELYFNVQGKRAIQFETKAELKDVWHLGSDTKSMSALLLALAVQEKKLLYDSKIIDLLSSNIKFHSANKDLLVSDLLTHQSGIKDVQEVQDGKLWKELSVSKKNLRIQRFEMAKAALEEEPHFDIDKKPNRSFSYANNNYIILGAILEKIYESDWESLMRKKLFKPLKMYSCGFGVAGKENETVPSQPWPHYVENNNLQGYAPQFKLDNPPLIGPAGAVHCSLEDWDKYISELTAMSNSSGKLVKDASVSVKYFSTQENGHYTLGGWGKIDKFKTPGFSHNGSNTFNYAIATFFPAENDVILITTNSGTSEAEAAMIKLHKELLNLIHK